MALRAYGLLTATLAMIKTRTCSLIFHGPGLRENSKEWGYVSGRRKRARKKGVEAGTRRAGRLGRGIR